MPIPSSFTDLDTNPNNNSPQGSENVGPNANGYIQALGAFVKQIYNGALKPTAAVDFNAQKITNLANGTVSSTSKDAVTGAQLQGVYKVGEVKMWHGAVANIASVWGPGWQLANGTNGTADLRDRFVVGAGLNYAANALGGSATQVLSVANLPAHNHGVTDPGHIHSVTDTGHVHGYTDPGHVHVAASTGTNFIASGGAGVVNFGGSSLALQAAASTASALVGITINNNVTGISIQNHTTGITTQNAGSGSAVDIRPPYYALCFIEYTGIGA
jgi:hypothetical protein